MKVCPKCKTELKQRYRCSKCSVVYRTKKEYNQSLYLIFGFFIIMGIFFLFLTTDFLFVLFWMLSPFIIWFLIYILTEIVVSYNDLELKWLGDKSLT